MPHIPTKLKRDAIQEALLEVRFDHDEMAEIVVGRLASSKHWKGYTLSRQPSGNLPIGMLETDPALRFQSTIQLDRPEPGELLRIGPRVLSVHVTKPYPGWSDFRPRLECLIQALYEEIPDPVINRVGLRYINALTPEHGFKSFKDLAFRFTTVAGEPDNLLAGFQLDTGNNSTTQTKIASMIYVQGEQIEDAVCYVDVDVFTQAAPGKSSIGELVKWVDHAHNAEKEVFFSLWPKDILKANELAE